MPSLRRRHGAAISQSAFRHALRPHPKLPVTPRQRRLVDLRGGEEEGTGTYHDIATGPDLRGRGCLQNLAIFRHFQVFRDPRAAHLRTTPNYGHFVPSEKHRFPDSQ